MQQSPALVALLQKYKSVAETAMQRGKKLNTTAIWEEWEQRCVEDPYNAHEKGLGGPRPRAHKLLREAAKTLYSLPPCMTDRDKYTNSLRRSFLTKDKMVFKTLSVAEDRDVSVAELGDIAIVRKSHDSEVGILVAAQLTQLCRQEQVEFVPYLCGWEEGRNSLSCVSYSEYIEGQTLDQAIKNGSLSDQELCCLMILLHGLLEWLWTVTGFVHGDLCSQNILLRKCDGKVPLMYASGKLASIDSKYYPVLVDFTTSVTNDYSRWSATVSPVVTPLVDILGLYSELVVVLPEGTAKSAVSHALSMCPLEGSSLPPCGVEVPGLSHDELMEYYLQDE